MRVLLMLITFLAISVPAKADLWRTYQIPNAPDFVFALPGSYTVFYYNSPSYESLPLTLKTQMATMLASNDAIAIAYSDDFTESITFFKYIDDYGVEFNNLSDKDLLQVGDNIISQASEPDPRYPNITVNFNESYILRSDHNSFVLVEGFRQIDGAFESMIRYSTCFNDCQLIMSVTSDEQFSPDDEELYDAIASSIIRIE